jgi:5-formyltetrahydrofolate cyclo-ligase
LELGIINSRTPIITTVHRLQIVDQKFALKPHDIPVNFIITSEEVIECKTKLERPKGIYWEYLDDEKINSIPLLKKMKARLRAAK